VHPVDASAPVEPLAVPDAGRWGILALLFLSMFVNLLDRQVLSVLNPLIREELQLTNTQYSYILFAFLLGMTLFQAPAGMLLDRRGARFGLPFLMLVWSLANALHSLARSVGQFCAFRFLLGAGECGNYSGGIKVIAQRFPPQERALAAGIFNSGTVVAALIAPWLIVRISQEWGWRAAFVVPSVLGLLWIFPWLAFYRDRRRHAATRAKVGVGPLLRTRQLWGLILARAIGGPVIHFYWYWLPAYLKEERHFSMEKIALLAGIPFLFSAAGSVVGGWLSSQLMSRGWTADSAR
jgi:MFS transporter, ACS family, hexuronate transporter